MPRGIHTFHAFTYTPMPPHARKPLFHRYGCPWCPFNVIYRARGADANALGRASRGKGAVRHHVLEAHPDKLKEI